MNHGERGGQDSELRCMDYETAALIGCRNLRTVMPLKLSSQLTPSTTPHRQKLPPGVRATGLGDRGAYSLAASHAMTPQQETALQTLLQRPKCS